MVESGKINNGMVAGLEVGNTSIGRKCRKVKE